MTGRCFILNFHGIGTPHDGIDASERPYWVSEDFFARVVDLVGARDNPERVRWTFDDGNRSDLTIGARLLGERGLTADFFLLTGRFDDPRYLSPADARLLVSMGMRIGLHGRDHVDWRRLTPDRLMAETVAARADLAEAAGTAIDRVAIPFGAYNRRVIAHLKRCGFRRIYTSDGGPSRTGDRICSRTSVRDDMMLEQIAALIDGRVPLVSKLRRTVSSTVRRHLL